MHRILIVDEDEHLLWALEKNLFPERDDLHVLTASDGEAGMEILKGGDIDLLVSDIKMPGKVDGFQLILRAKEIAPEARVVIMTTFGSGRIESFADRMGITHYIEKPFNISELRSMALDIFDEGEGFQGMLSDLELTDIIQMLCLAKRSTLLHLKHRDHRGKIVFDRGELVHAEFDTLEGPVAVYRMLALRQGDIFMESDADYHTRTIRMGWQDLLLEAVRRDDEARLAEATRAREKEESSQDNIPFASFHTSESAEIDTNQSELGDRATSPGLGDAASVDTNTSKNPRIGGAPSFEQEDEDAFPPGAHTDRLNGDSFFTEAELQEISMASSVAMEDSGAFDQVSQGFDDADEAPVSGRSEHPWRGPHSSAQIPAVLVDSDDDDADEEALIQGLMRDGGEAVDAPAPLAEQPRVTQEAIVAPQAAVAPQPAQSVGVLATLEDFVTDCARLRATGLTGPGLVPEANFVETSRAGSRDPALMSQRMLDIVDCAHRVANSLSASSSVNGLQLTFEDAYVVIRRVGGAGHFHFALVERDASLGVVLVVMRQFAPRLEAALQATV
ncbi:DUF4388 domain-containing protein [Bradymonas sediminis]|uniref:Uncharacterized protein n=1 Tax=Bradymonas sediminis TaxID=1548548 RepID=A0A2Z4FKE6_9DELT|nr:DUF4388 domain-containing protein [Bradymonas sediminis]AWV89423.1 hypothetical protein DN745_08760 [Bradymonas sediminis]TDP73605.1 response regulator receiver domain-containing protein [Bradymonas sediminis]